MTTPPFSDEAVERILQDFFAREMPADLRALPDRPMVPGDGALAASPTKRPGGWTRWKTGLFTLAMAACGILMAVAIPRIQSAVAPQTASPDREVSPGGRDLPETTVRALRSPHSERPHAATTGDDAPLIIVDGAANDDRRAPEDRREPVEARASRQWTTVGEEDDPESKTDYSVPNEISVEILPLEGDPVEPRTPPQPPSDTRLPEERRSND